MDNELNTITSRRRFLGTLTTGAAAMSVAGILSPLQQIRAGQASTTKETNDPNPEEWLKKINGKHKIVFDVTQPHGIFPFAWPKVFLMTNAATGTPEKDCSVVVVLRHDAIGYAMEDRLWKKYNFAEVFNAKDHGPAFQAADAAQAVSFRNPFWKPSKGDFKVPGIGEVQIGINELQDNGVIFTVCQAAMTVYSNAVAAGMNMGASEVLDDWRSGLLPGIYQVPSGVWAIGRAQEKGCGYCFAG